MSDPIRQFEEEVAENIRGLDEDEDVQGLSRAWMREVTPHKYSYNFRWMGRPIIQYPQDIVALQEIIWSLKPDLIIETGIAHGGSLIFEASMLELLGNDGLVLGIDIDIRDHNRREIEAHPMAKRIQMIQGSSIDEEIVAQVREIAKDRKTILVLLDSNHTHDHVLDELRLYSEFVTKDSYLIVYDTIVEHMPDHLIVDRPWGKGNSPKSAVWAFLEETKAFEIDRALHNKLLITVAPDGYLKRVAD